MSKRAKHPTQPLVINPKMAGYGRLRFKPNKIVRYLLDNNGKLNLGEAGFPEKESPAPLVSGSEAQVDKSLAPLGAKGGRKTAPTPLLRLYHKTVVLLFIVGIFVHDCILAARRPYA